jgi:hypothetical protein
MAQDTGLKYVSDENVSLSSNEMIDFVVNLELLRTFAQMRMEGATTRMLRLVAFTGFSCKFETRAFVRHQGNAFTPPSVSTFSL